MKTIHKLLQMWLFVWALLFIPTYASAAREGDTCRIEDKLPKALAHAQQHERESGEFTHVEFVPGSFARQQIVDDIVEYSVMLKVGPGEHDVIRLHRVVREQAPCKPLASHEPVFLLHGATIDFRTAFLGSTLSPHVPREQSLAVFLAQRDIDVWGLDMRSTLIPLETTDFNFMRDWNYATDIHDIAVSLGIVRHLRKLTGNGFGKMHLIGWSNGGTLTYAYANHETRFPRGQRHVKGLIPVDIAFKFSPTNESLRQDACTRAAAIQAVALNAGIFATDERATRTIGFLAETAANEPSPFVPGLTNRTVVLFGGAVTWQAFFPPGFPPYVPFYHTLAGQFDPVSGLPNNFTFSRDVYLFDLLQAFPSWWVMREAFELNALQCNELDLPYDDHLAAVKVPVLYVGARGGFGEYGVYSTTLLGSRDVTSLVVSLVPEQPLDFGHSDLFWADNALTLVWEPIYNWLRNH